IVVQVLEGESSRPAECAHIGRAIVRNLPEGLAQGHPVEVTFEYGSNGCLKVDTMVPGTEGRVTLELERDGGLGSKGLAGWKQPIGDAAGFDAFEAMVAEALCEIEDATSQTTSNAVAPSPAPTPATATPVTAAPAEPTAEPEPSPPPGVAPSTPPQETASKPATLPKPYTANKPRPAVPQKPLMETVSEQLPSEMPRRPKNSPGSGWVLLLVFYLSSVVVGGGLAYFVLSLWNSERFPLPW
ncbi:MAG: hypothetical protein U9N87_11455, partial [Planctomycetota bacterium]|nr:hypothetical protein [Planctomycetota bacterium]